MSAEYARELRHILTLKGIGVYSNLPWHYAELLEWRVENGVVKAFPKKPLSDAAHREVVKAFKRWGGGYVSHNGVAYFEAVLGEPNSVNQNCGGRSEGLRATAKGRIKLNEALNEMQALIALNTSIRNVLLAKLAYTKGAVDYSVVVKMKKLCDKTFDVIIASTSPNAREKIVELTNELRKQILGKEEASG